MNELLLGSVTVAREFVAATGTVFAVTWQGPVNPDLNQLFGVRFPRLVAAGQNPHGDHRVLRVTAPDFVIESGGMMRAVAGRAYLPALVPASLAIGDVR